MKASKLLFLMGATFVGEYDTKIREYKPIQSESEKLKALEKAENKRKRKNAKRSTKSN